VARDVATSHEGCDETGAVAPRIGLWTASERVDELALAAGREQWLMAIAAAQGVSVVTPGAPAPRALGSGSGPLAVVSRGTSGFALAWARTDPATHRPWRVLRLLGPDGSPVGGERVLEVESPAFALATTDAATVLAHVVAGRAVVQRVPASGALDPPLAFSPEGASVHALALAWRAPHLFAAWTTARAPAALVVARVDLARRAVESLGQWPLPAMPGDRLAAAASDHHLALAYELPAPRPALHATLFDLDARRFVSPSLTRSDTLPQTPSLAWTGDAFVLAWSERARHSALWTRLAATLPAGDHVVCETQSRKLPRLHTQVAWDGSALLLAHVGPSAREISLRRLEQRPAPH
jgi:hypothetical protein